MRLTPRPSWWLLLAGVVPPLATPARADVQLLCPAEAAGGYAAFPDVCRLKNGDLYCVFYSGYSHVAVPNSAMPKGGRIMAVRSGDGGRTWARPAVILDTPFDDRDPSVACLKDGTLLVSWFTVRPGQVGKDAIHILLSRSTDAGKNWGEPTRVRIDSPHWFACSSPVRELPDGSLLLGLYHEDDGQKLGFGATVKSYDGGKTWKDLALIGDKARLHLDAETDVILLKGGRLLAALRSPSGMYSSRSADMGKTWGPVQRMGFPGHCPYFLRHSSGVILLAHRLPATCLHWSADEGESWKGPVAIDSSGGAYPSLVELPGGQVYAVYYDDGKTLPGIRGALLRVGKDGVTRVAPAKP